MVISEHYANDRIHLLNQMRHNMFRYAPTCLDTQKSKYYSEQYRQNHEQQHETTQIMNWLVEKMTYPISQMSLDVSTGLSFWGWTPHNVSEAKTIYLLRHALHFKTLGLGNCAYRAAYAAIELAKVFFSTHAGIEVRLRSYPEIDQFVVIVGNTSSGWTVYDPLTNPDLVFDLAEYDERIKPCFQVVGSPKQAFELTIDRGHIKQYQALVQKMLYFIQTEADKLCAQSLRQDSHYRWFLQEKGITDPTGQKTKQAIQHVLAQAHAASTPMLADRPTRMESLPVGGGTIVNSP